MNDIFFTIERPVKDIIHKEKDSKFWGHAFPINTIEDVKDCLKKIKKQHPTARHYCYAYRIGVENNVQYRANDDGEPNGTAGTPIYNQILSHQLTNILVVSVRYFGGTKLGVSGLIKAYKTNTKDILQASSIIEKHIKDAILVQFEYPQLSKIMNIIKKNNGTILKQRMELSCEIQFAIRKTKTELLLHDLSLIKNVTTLLL